MNYNSCNLCEVIEQINQQKILLPAIQRKFVWHYSQIECLFDSIMRGYPIGTFLFWKIKGTNEINKYTFYKFIQEYHERDSINEVASNPIQKDEIIGILDGQQRLTSIYIALQGSYAYKKPYCKSNNDNSYPKRNLYLNLFNSNSVNEDGMQYEFKFLEDSFYNENEFWYNVKNIFTDWIDIEDIENIYPQLLNSIEGANVKEKFIKDGIEIRKTLRRLYTIVKDEKLINYCEISKNDLDSILDMFIRVNDGGTPLSKTDLLLSTMIANWVEARDEVEELIISLNKKGEGFKFTNDVIMKSALCLIEKPVQFKVKNFNKDIVNQIKTNWENIKSALVKAADLLAELGFCSENITSYNAIIPIAYYIYNNGLIDFTTKNDIKKYFVIALIKQIFGRASDTVISDFREIIKNEKTFTNLMISKKLKQNEKFDIDHDFINEILSFKKGMYTFLILTLLYPNLKYSQNSFHQDHLHPDSFFTSAKLKSANIDESLWKDWQQKKDTLPNLQILERKENEQKLITPLEKWVNENYKDAISINNFKTISFIEKDCSLDFKDFDIFYQKRSEKLSKKLKELFNIE
ncbi:MAG: DUF262 domain-containing protein [Candidatus Gastranaerophilales bacterium]|nr:DUF262 domain-containing protein [Candidatus Gastranaerophilales bacterium]